MPMRKPAKPSADRICDAAEKVFAKHGYEAVSLRQLMAAAGVSTTAFYARFSSKEAVMAELTTRLFADLYAEAPRALAQVRSLDSGIERGIDLLCERFADRKALVRLILSEAGSSAVAMKARRDAYHLLATFLASRLRSLARRGEVAAADPEALAWAVVGALEMQFVRWAVWDEIELPALRAQLRGVARAILRATEVAS